jgi:hypothetical protein
MVTIFTAFKELLICSVGEVLGLRTARTALYDLVEINESSSGKIKNDDMQSYFKSSCFKNTLQFLLKDRSKSENKKNDEKIDFYLPIVMEQLLMCIQCGMDILPALEAVCQYAKLHQRYQQEYPIDPVTEIFELIVIKVEKGIAFQDAVDEELKKTGSSSLRHALTHLLLAHKEGGEVTSTLQELSDATQIFYQEHIEEKIAKLPAKATLPLLTIFGGLILCLIAVPLVQVLVFTSKNKTDEMTSMSIESSQGVPSESKSPQRVTKGVKK